MLSPSEVLAECKEQRPRLVWVEVAPYTCSAYSEGSDVSCVGLSDRLFSVYYDVDTICFCVILPKQHIGSAYRSVNLKDTLMDAWAEIGAIEEGLRPQ